MEDTHPNRLARRTTLVTFDLTAHHRDERRGPALTSDARALGLRRRIVPTSAGRIVVRSGAVTGDVATILLHGAAGSWTTWSPLLRAAAHSGEPLRNVIAVDLPGWGESPAAHPVGGVAQLSDAVREVAQTLGYQRWILVGHSLGGFLALDLAARHPGDTEAVLLISPSGPAVIDAIRHPLRGGSALPGFAGMLLIMRFLAALGPVGRRLVRSVHSVGMLRALSAPLFTDPKHVHRSVIEALSQEVRPWAFVDAARAAARYDESRWRAVASPVRAVYGERDVFARASDRADLARLVRDFDAATVPGAGHFAAVEQPECVLQALRSLPDRRRADPSRPAPASAGHSSVGPSSGAQTNRRESSARTSSSRTVSAFSPASVAGAGT